MRPARSRAQKSERGRISVSADAPGPSPRQRLLATGVRLIAERGVEGVNSNIIARAAGLGVGTFYAHFEDKHELHRAVVMRAFELLQRDLARVSSAVEGEDPAAQVRALVATVVDFAEANPELFRVAFGRPPPPAKRGRPALGFSPRATERRLRELQQAGQLDPALDPEIAARGFAGMQNAVLLWWLGEPARRPREQLIETLVRLHPAISGGRASSFLTARSVLR